jgi:hypothetical protein
MSQYEKGKPIVYSYNTNLQTNLLKNLYREIYENTHSYDFPVKESGGVGGIDRYNINVDNIRKVLSDINLGPCSLHGEQLTDSDYKYICKWFPTDSKEHFDNNCEDKITKSLLEKLNWIDNDIDYCINRQGFRAKDFDKIDTKCILFSGCSQTFGIGVNLQDTFSGIVSKHFNRQGINLGIPGYGLDVQSIYFSLFVDKEINPQLIDAVVIYVPPPGRIINFYYENGKLTSTKLQEDVLFSTKKYEEEYLDEIPFSLLNNTIETLGINSNSSTEEVNNFLEAGMSHNIDYFRSKNLEHYVMTRENNFLRDVSAINSIKLFCMENNIPLIIEKQDWQSITMAEDLARDLSHHGIRTHKDIANRIISKLELILDK